VIDQTSITNHVSLMLGYFDLPFVLAQVRSCSKFDLTLGVISSV
jgi:hypothetical protein